MADERLPAEVFRERLLAALGGPWPEPAELNASVSHTQACDGYTLEFVAFDAEPNDRAPAVLLLPDGVSAEWQAAAICVLHQHNNDWSLGKSEPAGLAGDRRQHVGVALARAGYVVLCIDALGFEERQSSELPGGDFERFLFLKYVVQGKSLAWKNILDIRRAVDYLENRSEVDATRIGCFGHSMGSTLTWMAGPWEPRFKALVGNCCLPTYAGIERHRLLHCFANFIPGILAYGDTPEIASLIAPRPLHLNFGELDAASPIEEVRAAVKTIAAAYERQNAGNHFTHFIEPETGHELTAEMWRRVEAFFLEHLGE